MYRLSRTWYTPWCCAMPALPHISGTGRSASRYVSSLEFDQQRNSYPCACRWYRQPLRSYRHYWRQISSAHSRLASQCSQEQGGASWSPEEHFVCATVLLFPLRSVQGAVPFQDVLLQGSRFDSRPRWNRYSNLQELSRIPTRPQRGFSSNLHGPFWPAGSY